MYTHTCIHITHIYMLYSSSEFSNAIMMFASQSLTGENMKTMRPCTNIFIYIYKTIL